MSKDDVEVELSIEEYKFCRDLIKLNIEIIEKSEVYAVGACAAIAAFCLSASDNSVQRAASWIPLIISLLGLIRYIGLDRTIKNINNYLVEIESRYEKINWTNYYRSNNKWKVLKRSRYSIWMLLAIFSIMLEAKIYIYWPFTPSTIVSEQCAKPRAIEKQAEPPKTSN